MRAKMHRILGNLHHLLSIGTYDDFVEASKIPGTPKHIKAALEALAREREKHDDDEDETSGVTDLTETLTFDRDNHEEENKVQEQKAAEAGGEAGGEGEQFIYDIMMNSGRLQSRKEIMAFAKNFKIRLVLRPDESRSFAARKLAKAIQASPKDVQSQALNALFTGNFNPPTMAF